MTVPITSMNTHRIFGRLSLDGMGESSGKLSSGPFQNEEKCLTGITHAKGKFRASP